MAVQGLWQAIEAWPLAQFVASSSWAFPTFESIHVIAIATVVGTIVVMDLRLLGFASNESRVTEISHDTLRWTWGAFAVALVTGLLLFIAKATDYMANPFFIWKMVLILMAGLNMAVFHLVTWRSIGRWDAGGAIAVPTGAKIAGGLSILLWATVVFLARAIGFTLDKFGT